MIGTSAVLLRVKQIALASVAGISIALASSIGAQAKTIYIATEGAYPPFNMTDSAGNLIGFDVEIAKALCAEMNANCEIVAQDWDGIIPGLVAEKYDAIIASMSITEERKQTVSFSEPYYSNHLRWVVSKGSDVRSIRDLRGTAVGAQRATVAAQYLEDHFGARLDIRLYDTQTAAWGDLQSGRIGAVLVDAYPAYDWLQENAGFTFGIGTVDINDKIGVAVRKSDKDLANEFSSAIKKIRSNGVYRRINAKYFPFDIY